MVKCHCGKHAVFNTSEETKGRFCAYSKDIKNAYKMRTKHVKNENLSDS